MIGGKNMAIEGLKILPPVVTTQEALELYKLVSKITPVIGRLNAELKHSIVHQSIFQILSLQESVQSTRIEGTQVTFADIIDQATTTLKSKEVVEVQNYQSALSSGVERINQGDPISSRMMKELHGILMDNDARGTTSLSGEFRRVQNFIGPDNKIENAVYIPISADKIPDYISNLEYYINGEKHMSYENVTIGENEVLLDENSDTLIKTAIVHAQFESIHPFLDGNGRLGRILIMLCFMLDKMIDYPVFFISEELEKERLRYYNRLNGVRGDEPQWYEWIVFFLHATERMANNLLGKLDKINQLAQDGLALINAPSHSPINKIWLYTFSGVFCNAKETSQALDITTQTARKYLNELADLKLIEKDMSKKRNQIYVNYDLLNILS